MWTDGATNQVWAYYAIAPTEIVRGAYGVTRSLSGGYSRIPGYLIARLALHQALHDQHLGGQLLLDAISRVVVAADVGGGHLVVVDALDHEAAAFYTKYGFVPVSTSPSRLVMKVATARAAIASTDPRP